MSTTSPFTRESSDEKINALNEELNSADETKYAPKDDTSEQDTDKVKDKKPQEEKSASDKKPVNEDTDDNKDVEDESDDENDDVEYVETQEEKKQDDSVFWNVSLSIIGLCVIIAGILVYKRIDSLPNPLQEAKQTIESLETTLGEKQEILANLQNKNKPKIEFVTLLNEYKKTQEQLLDEKQTIVKEQQKLGEIRNETKSYFNQYRSIVRRNARGRKLEVLRTVNSGKTFLNVEISRVEPNQVKIIHEGGSTSVSANDLPDSLREELGYGDPLNLAAMEQQDTNVPSAARPSQAPQVTTPKVNKPVAPKPTTTKKTDEQWSPPPHQPL